MTDAQCTVMVFTRMPVPGSVKTRLIPSLGAEGAAELYRDLLWRTLATAASAAVGPLQLWCTPSTDHPFLCTCAGEFGAGLRLQRGNTLGDRMHHAFAACTGPALLTGCDCPGLCASDLTLCAEWLSGGVDAVLGPAEDGGYYLAGLGAPAPGLFTAMEWGGSSVLDATRTRLRELGLKWRELPEHWDVDRPEDLARLAAMAAQSRTG